MDETLDVWPAQRRLAQIYYVGAQAMAAASAMGYRGPRTDDFLELLRINSYAELQKAKSKFLGGQLTWARVADAAVTTVGKAMLGGDVERALEAAEDAHALADRLRERDKHPSARVTQATRTRITMLDALGSCVETAVGLRDGTVRPDDFDALGRMLSLRSRWFALRRELAQAHADKDWVLELVQAAAGKVLSSGAGPGAKAMASRAVAAWTSEASASTSVTPAASQRASPERGPSPAPKRTRLGEGDGERVEWTDEDDLF